MSYHKKNLYRPNVAAVVINKYKQVLICQRVDNGAWQFPQGGVDKNEPAIHALFRELSEEIGTTNLRAISTCSGTFKYKWPSHLPMRDEYIGQEQTYYLVEYIGPDDGITLDNREFKSFKWVDKDMALSKTEKVRQKTYKIVLEEFAPYL